MHILNVTTATLDDLIEPVDLGQRPAELVAASFSDSDLGALAAASRGAGLPELRLAALRDLRHPMSVDLWVDAVVGQARAVVVRLLGGYDWWAYGCDRLAGVARERGIALALLPGECREEDAQLAALSTVSREEQAALLACFREGGPENMAAVLARMARLAGHDVAAPVARAVPRAGLWVGGRVLPLAGGGAGDAAGCACAVLSLDAARERPGADRRAGGGARCRGDRGGAGVRAEPARCGGAGRGRAGAGGDAAGGAGDGDGLRGRRGGGALRAAGGAGLPGGAGDDAARGLGGGAARAGAGGFSRCTWCCRSSTGASSRGRCRSRRRPSGTRGWG